MAPADAKAQVAKREYLRSKSQFPPRQYRENPVWVRALRAGRAYLHPQYGREDGMRYRAGEVREGDVFLWRAVAPVPDWVMALPEEEVAAMKRQREEQRRVAALRTRSTRIVGAES
jgi:hypothetical protein